MTNLTPARLAEIKATCEAATSLSTPYGSVQGHRIRLVSIDIPDLIAAVERLQIALRNLYNDCRNEPCDEQRSKVMDEAGKALGEQDE